MCVCVCVCVIRVDHGAQESCVGRNLRWMQVKWSERMNANELYANVTLPYLTVQEAFPMRKGLDCNQSLEPTCRPPRSRDVPALISWRSVGRCESVQCCFRPDLS